MMECDNCGDIVRSIVHVFNDEDEIEEDLCEKCYELHDADEPGDMYHYSRIVREDTGVYYD